MKTWKVSITHELLSFPPEGTQTTSVPLARASPMVPSDLKAHTCADLLKKSDTVHESTSDNW